MALQRPDMDLCGVEVWVSKHPRTWESESACECVQMAQACDEDSAHLCLQKLSAFVI